MQWLGRLFSRNRRYDDLAVSIQEHLAERTEELMEEGMTREEVEVRIKPRPGWTSANDQGVVVVLSTELTAELIAEGLARDAVRIIQDRRKEIGCEYTDRVEIGIVTESRDLRQAIEKFIDYIKAETLAINVVFEPLGGVEPAEVKLGDWSLRVFLSVVR